MSLTSRSIARLSGYVLPVCIYVAVILVHIVYVNYFPEKDPDQAGWATMPIETSWIDAYVETGAFWMGHSYGISLAFAAWALWRYHKHRRCSTVAIGSIGFSGFLLLAGCFLVGCCGSPMLIVWLNLFGAAFLPFARPLLALLTTITVGFAWWRFSKTDPCGCTPVVNQAQ